MERFNWLGVGKEDEETVFFGLDVLFDLRKQGGRTEFVAVLAKDGRFLFGGKMGELFDLRYLGFGGDGTACFFEINGITWMHLVPRRGLADKPSAFYGFLFIENAIDQSP